MKRYKATAKNVHIVLADYSKWIKEEPTEGRKYAAEMLNEMLDTMSGEDFFGTEGQCDPRGDQRND
ncbi:MAG TPA: hypothetical protein VM577_03250 [Anaerovoracaceae bacterium]|nr:hypothetical protein [Anaerovoracaceae bacterium]